VEETAVKETGFSLIDAWMSLSAEPAWTDITAWLAPIIAIFLTLFAIELRRGYRE
jgi:hypothetical protein